ncbi:hypothetical protein Pelo_9521 [Pelomyxa schiedti]|nr:hypothetical protein Pelo_9521 [Pelomyxa schiedti]
MSITNKGDNLEIFAGIDVQQLLETELPSVLTLVSSSSWSKVTHKNDVTVSKQTVDGRTAFLTSSILPFAYEDVLRAVVDTQEHKFYDNAILSYDVVQVICEDESCKADIVRLVSAPAARGMISAREFIDVRLMVPIEDGLAVMQRSIECGPVQDSDEITVRGWTFPSGSIIRRRADGTTEIDELVNTDLRGNIPVWLINKTLPSVRCSLHGKLFDYLAGNSASASSGGSSSGNSSSEGEAESE